MEKIDLSTFPSNRSEALAMLWLQQQDLKGKSPAEVQTMYFQALTEIRKDYRNKCDSGYFRELTH